MPIDNQMLHFFAFVVKGQLEANMNKIKIDDDLTMEDITSFNQS